MADQRSACRSLGVLLYTLVYGAMPFDGSNFKRLVKQITTGDYFEPKQPSSKEIRHQIQFNMLRDTWFSVSAPFWFYLIDLRFSLSIWELFKNFTVSSNVSHSFFSILIYYPTCFCEIILYVPTWTEDCGYSGASSLIKGMLTVAPDQRASILDICSHWWVNQGYSR